MLLNKMNKLTLLIIMVPKTDKNINSNDVHIAAKAAELSAPLLVEALFCNLDAATHATIKAMNTNT